MTSSILQVTPPTGVTLYLAGDSGIYSQKKDSGIEWTAVRFRFPVWAQNIVTECPIMLTAVRIKNAKPKERPYKIYDSQGLLLLVNPNGKKHWRYRYQYNNLAKTLSLGPYPLVSLKKARDDRDTMLLKLKNGIDPSAERKRAKMEAVAEKGAERCMFEFVALEYLLKQAGQPPKSNKTLANLREQLDRAVAELAGNPASKARAGTLNTMRRRLERFVFPYLGKRAIGDITGPQMLVVIRKIEDRGIVETAHRTLAICRRVCRFAVSEGKADFDAAGSIDSRESLVPVKRGHFPTITDPRKIGELMRALHGYQGQPATEAALKLLPLVFVRPGELRGAEWTEFDLDTAEWRIPAEKMKMGREHVVALASQAVCILKDMQPLTGDGRFVFPGLRGRNRFMSENTMNSALRRLGYSKDQICPHGFRAMASTRLNELGFNGDLIELQLAHKPLDKIRAAYNRAERMEERRQMMQQWADYLDELRKGKNKVVAIRRGPMA